MANNALERIAASFGWKDAVAAIALAGAVFGGVIWAHERGLDKGYAKCQRDGHKAGAAESCKTDSHANFLEVGQGYLEANLMIRLGGEATARYTVLIAEEKTDETICVLSGKEKRCYSDTDLFYQSGIRNVHDGKVDVLSVQDGKEITEYHRARDYNAKKDAFDNADIDFEALKQMFAMKGE